MNDSTPTTDRRSVRQIFLRWERWRLGYNAALAAVVLAIVALFHDDQTDWPELGWLCLVGAFVANLCYFAGPVVESYLNWLGARLRGITLILFCLGTLFAIGLAAIAVLSNLNSL